MISTVDVKVDEAAVKELYMEQIANALKEVDAELVFWDAKELMKRTCMSWNFIQDQFFFDPRFPKFKVSNKWYFPAKEAKEFLILWLKERKEATP